MNKFIFILILFVGFSFGSTQSVNEKQDQHYASLDKEDEVVIAAHRKDTKKKSPLRKRFHKRKRRVRNPAQGK